MDLENGAARKNGLEKYLADSPEDFEDSRESEVKVFGNIEEDLLK